MKNKYKGYFILDITSPESANIQDIRSRYDKLTSQLPVERTVAGSSGIGPLLPGQPLENIINDVDSIIGKIKPFIFNFKRITNFPNTNIYYLEPEQREPFDNIHNIFKDLNFEYAKNLFPYNPHYTLRTGSFSNSDEKNKLMKEKFPKKSIRIDSLSLLEFNQEPFIYNYLHTWKLE